VFGCHLEAIFGESLVAFFSANKDNKPAPEGGERGGILIRDNIVLRF
jgi:hypothetical protein